MPKKDFINHNFDPYAELVMLNQKMDRLEKAHNAMARDYHLTQNELHILLESHQHLQNAVLAMSKVVGTGLLKDFPLK